MDENKPIPKDFLEFETGEHFKRCIQCECDLLEEGTRYIIERSIRRYPGMKASDVVYEYAMCLECVVRQKEEMSSESLQNLESYFLNNMSMEKMKNSYDLDKSTGSCAVYGTGFNEMSEYVSQATCNGKHLDPMMNLMVLGERAMGEMEELISQKTRDEMDDFIDQHFSGPPEWRELLKRKPVLI